MTIQGTKTEWEKESEGRWKDGNFEIAIVEMEKAKSVENREIHTIVSSWAEFVSTFTELERALHKIKLDIITNATHDMREPIKIYVRRLE